MVWHSEKKAVVKRKGLFTLSESESEKDQSVSGKHQRKFLFSLSLPLSVNGP